MAEILRSKGPVRMDVVMIAGNDGGKLRAGTSGWLIMRLRNTGATPFQYNPFVLMGKGGMNISRDGNPPFISDSDRFYAGIAVMSLSYSWANNGRDKIIEIPLSPPETLNMQPNDGVCICRRIVAPLHPGYYCLTVSMDSLPVTNGTGANLVNMEQYEQQQQRLQGVVVVHDVYISE